MERDLQDDQFRENVVAWLDANVPAGLSGLTDWVTAMTPGHRFQSRAKATEHPIHREWEQRCLDARLVCAQWPQSHGGRGWSRSQRAIFEEELILRGIPRIDRGAGEFLLGPAVIANGSPEQAARLLPPIISGDVRYCQGFSEPGSGSDLASITTVGVVGDSGEIRITGQKIWTSDAARANRIFVLCRTEPGSKRHKGLSFVLADLTHDNHIDVRPIRQLTGSAEFAEVFFDGTRAPISDVIGGLGNGWAVAMSTLAVERDFNLPTLALNYYEEFRDFVENASAADLLSDPIVRQDIATAYSHTAVMRMLGLRIIDAQPDEEARVASVSKLFWSEYHQWFSARNLELAGSASLVRPAGDAQSYLTTPAQDLFLATRADTIYAGTSQIQRNIIAERTLGLPR